MAMSPCREYPVRTGAGYGTRRTVREDGTRELVAVHRWVWEQINGPIPVGMVVMHTCDNPPCFLYEHLMLGTRSDNQRDMIAKGRRGGNSVPLDESAYRIGDVCIHGHPFTDENTYWPPGRGRQCRTCHREAIRRYAGGG